MIRFCSRLIINDIKKLNNIVSSVRSGCNPQQPTRSIGPIFSFNTCHLRHQSTATPPAAQADPEETDSDLKIAELPMTPLVVSVVGIMQDFGFTDTDIKKLMINQPALLKTRANLWSDTVGTLIKCGFENAEILSILEGWPKVLSIKNNDMVRRIQAWTESGLGEKLMFEVLTSNPHFLEVDHVFVSKRIKQYQLYFENKKRVGKLFMLAPNTLEENWKIIVDKLNYLNELCTDESDIVSSGVLAHSLFHIKARHEFLIRAGIYKRPSKDFNKKLSKNPKLESIVNKTDDDFVSDIAGLSRFEYDVFLEIYKEELDDDEVGYDSDDAETYKFSYKKYRK
ncbi:uncharacterized protein LOC124357040 isoform X2 [Homalodisca vitripennis]|nr:uncharacterized protein LOC124357040 isoform X2 [Homalodisca vitripennis]KAG8327446.1 Transcription termination factor 4 [Homalodisca vitripennis]